METCVATIPKETVPTHVNTASKGANTLITDEILSQKDIQSIPESVNEHDSSSEDEIKVNSPSYVSKTEAVIIKYELSATTTTQHQCESKHTVTQLQRVRDSLLMYPSTHSATNSLFGVNHFDELLLCGFIGDIETKNSLFPIEICKIILIYYSAFIGNVFDSSKCSQNLEIHDEILRNNKVRKMNDAYGYFSAYHSVWMNSLSKAVVIYHLSVICSRSTSVFIGFCATDSVIEDGYWANTEDYSYAVSLGGSKYINGHRQDCNDMCALSIASGDNIEIKLDLINDEISIKSIYGEELIIFENVKKRYGIEYKFAAGFSWNSQQNDSIIVNNIEHYRM